MAPNPAAEAFGKALGSAGSWDWIGPLRVALTLLFTSGVLALILGVAGRPAVPGAHYTFHLNMTWLGWLWTSVFGTNLGAGASYQGAHAGASLGAWPLTLTVLTFAAGIWMFRRSTVTETRPLALLGFALRTSVMVAVPLFIVSWIARSHVSDIVRLDRSRDIPSEMSKVDIGFHVGPSTVGALFMPILTVFIVLALSTLLRADVFGARFEKLRGWFAGAVKGAAALLVVSIPAGIIGELAMWFARPHADQTHLTFHQGVNLAAGFGGWASNVGLGMLSLGSFGTVGVGGQVSVAHIATSVHKGALWLAQDHSGSQGDKGVYVAFVLAPLILAFMAWRVSRGTAKAQQIGGWLVSLLVVLPILFHFASFRGSASVSGVSKLADSVMNGSGSTSDDFVRGMLSSFVGSLPNEASVHGFAGIPGSSMWLVWLFALVAGAIAAFVSGAISPEAIARMKAASAQLKQVPTAAPTQAPTAPPVTYQVGDVVNGHRFDGTTWQPLP
ncbi:hypothetical protein GCM10027076_08190 [Nocardioides montaniterrae]